MLFIYPNFCYTVTVKIHLILRKYPHRLTIQYSFFSNHIVCISVILLFYTHDIKRKNVIPTFRRPPLKTSCFLSNGRPQNVSFFSYICIIFPLYRNDVENIEHKKIKILENIFKMYPVASYKLTLAVNRKHNYL